MDRRERLEQLALMSKYDMWKVGGAVNDMAKLCHEVSKLQGFYDGFDIEDWQENYMFPVKIGLIMTELGEAIEGHRKGDIENVNEEMADIFIRLMDLAEAIGMDMEAEVARKMEINLSRPYKHSKAY